MSILYTKEENGCVINITDEVECSYKENYANADRTAYSLEAFGAGSSFGTYWQQTYTFTMDDPWLVRDGGNSISPIGSWVKALYFTHNSDNAPVLAIAGNNTYNSLVFGDRQQYCPSTYWDPNNFTDMQAAFSCNVPIFETQEEAEAYCAETVESERQRMIREGAVNYVNPEATPETKRYFIWTDISQVDVLRGQVTERSGNKSYRCTAFDANTMPALYFVNDGADFQLGLKATDVVAGYSMPAPQTVFEMVPESSWHDYEIGYDGVYYTNMANLVGSDYDFPADGTYSYGSYFYTNIPIMKNETAADAAIDSGDYSDAVNWDNISGGTPWKDPDFGEKETSTSFGDGTFSSPFVAQYVMSASGVRKVSSIFFGDDQGLIDDIKKGLELFGAKPVDAIMSLMAFPFDVTDVVNCTETHDLYFGSYRHVLQDPINRVGNMLANYLNAGTIYLAPIFSSWRDYKYITLSVFLPFIGWQELVIEKYIKKSVNIRYYIDINTRQCAAVLVADGVMTDYYIGEIGVELPIVGSNFADYARSEIQHIGNTVKGMLNPVSPEALTNLGAASANASGIGQEKLGLNYSQYKLGQNGSPKDMQMQKGSFSSGLGMYLPQYVMFRYDIHDVAEPDILNDLAGKPSTASGKISNFSGFLSGRVSKLNTSGMTDAEIQEVQSAIMNDGIYL